MIGRISSVKELSLEGLSTRTRSRSRAARGRPARRRRVLEELQGWAGKNTAVAKREGYFFEVVPPIYPLAPGMFERALPIDGINLQAG